MSPSSIKPMNNELVTQLTPQLLEARRQVLLLQEAASKHDGAPMPDVARPPVDPALLQALAEAKRTWEAIPANQARLAAMRQMPLPELVQALREVAADPIFAPAFAMGKRGSTQALSGDFSAVPGCFSVGLAGQVDLGAGVTGTIGYAFDPNDTTQYSIFVSVGVVVGADAEADAGVELGVWSSAPTDMSGAMMGGTVGLDPEGFGASVAGFVGCQVSLVPPFVWPSLSSWGATLTLSLGVGGGAAGVFCYTLVIITESVPAIAQPDAQHMIMISSIKCVQKQDNASDKDELVMLFQIDGAGPTYPFPTWSHFSIEEGGTWNCGRSIKFSNHVVVTLQNGGDDIYSWTISWPPNSTYSCDYKDGLNEIAYTLYVSSVY